MRHIRRMLGGMTCAAATLLCSPLAHAQHNQLTLPGDIAGSITSAGAVNPGANANGERRVGSSANANIGLTNYYLFQLPDPSAFTSGQSEAGLEFTFTSRAASGTEPPFNADVYGLGWLSGAAPPDEQTFAPWYYGDVAVDSRSRNSLGLGSVASGNVSLLVDDLIKPSLTQTMPGRLETGPNASIKMFIQSLYADGAQAGDYAVIQLAADNVVADNNIVPATRGYEVGIYQETRPYQKASLQLGSMPVVADSFGTSRNRLNQPVNDTYESGYGFGGAWVPSSLALGDAYLRNVAAMTGPLTFSSSLGTYDGGPTAAEILGSDGVVNNPMRRELAAPMTDDVYFRFMVRADLNADADDMLVMWLSNNAGTDSSDHGDAGAMLGFRGDQFIANINNMDEMSEAGFTGETTHMLVGRLFKANPGDGYNRLEFWVNPELGDSPSGLVELAGANAGFTSVSHVGFMTGASTESTDLYFVDHLAIGASMLDVLGVASLDTSPVVPGDFNGDGNVDGADFVIWQTNFPNNTGMATLATGDANGDGNVDGADFVVWQTNFPTTSGGATPVPESSSLLLAALGGVVLLGCRKMPGVGRS